jgi:hypothetical protein
MGRSQINGKSGNTLEVDSNGAAQVSLAGSIAKDAPLLVPNDNADLPKGPTLGIMVQSTGDLKVRFANGTQDETLATLQPGIVYPFSIKKVYATGTTVTGVRGLYP